jgi:hypothetical protein
MRIHFDRAKMLHPGPTTQVKSFHWKGSRDANAEHERRFDYVTKVEVWDEPIDATQVRD